MENKSWVFSLDQGLLGTREISMVMIHSVPNGTATYT